MPNPFTPIGSTVNIAATNATQNVQLPAEGDSVKILNNSPVAAFINFGPTNAVTAALATSMPVLPNSDQVFSVPPGVEFAAVILPSGTGTVYFTKGDGE